jgi:hypothetical protein
MIWEILITVTVRISEYFSKNHNKRPAYKEARIVGWVEALLGGVRLLPQSDIDRGLDAVGLQTSVSNHL